MATYRASGLTMKAWCNANQCSVEQLKYWLYKIKRGSSQTTQTQRLLPYNLYLLLLLIHRAAFLLFHLLFFISVKPI
ncbi:IS66 family insertion sequence element accessory protein TnpA [Paenibacillus sp. NPDC056579]|uniref:IS66 family insertion sequence element accessory protein TnpA n=1 Tax=Paenibacillus sp. NPDC056579 TaxID=3345871 RepID=UPI0036D2EF95